MSIHQDMRHSPPGPRMSFHTYCPTRTSPLGSVVPTDDRQVTGDGEPPDRDLEGVGTRATFPGPCPVVVEGVAALGHPGVGGHHHEVVGGESRPGVEGGRDELPGGTESGRRGAGGGGALDMDQPHGTYGGGSKERGPDPGAVARIPGPARPDGHSSGETTMRRTRTPTRPSRHLVRWKRPSYHRLRTERPRAPCFPGTGTSSSRTR